MTILAVFALITIGIVLIILEILVLPGLIVGIIGGTLTIAGIYMSYRNFGSTAGHLTMLGTIIATILSLYFALKSKTWDKMALNSTNDGKVNVIEEDTVKVGDEGVTISRLAPMGKVLVNDNYFEAESRNQFIDPNTKIVVLKVLDNKLIVKPIN